MVYKSAWPRDAEAPGWVPACHGPRGAPLAPLFTSTEPSRNSSAKTAAPPLLRLTWLAPVRNHPTAQRARQSARCRGRRFLEVLGARAGVWRGRSSRGEGVCARVPAIPGEARVRAHACKRALRPGLPRRQKVSCRPRKRKSDFRQSRAMLFWNEIAKPLKLTTENPNRQDEGETFKLVYLLAQIFLVTVYNHCNSC